MRYNQWKMSKQKALERAIHILKTGKIYPEEDDLLAAAKLEELRRTLERSTEKNKIRYHSNKSE